MLVTRRRVLTGLIAAPVIVRAGLLMPINYRWEGATGGPGWWWRDARGVWRPAEVMGGIITLMPHGLIADGDDIVISYTA